MKSIAEYAARGVETNDLVLVEWDMDEGIAAWNGDHNLQVVAERNGDGSYTVEGLVDGERYSVLFTVDHDELQEEALDVAFTAYVAMLGE